MLRKFTILDVQIPQYFASIFTASEHKIGSLYYGERLIDERKTSVVVLTDSGTKVFKLIKPRSWHECLKHLWRHSRVYKEVHGNRTLARLGLRTPRIFEVGTALWPPTSKKFPYLGYHCMENLCRAGYEEAYRHYTHLPEHDVLRAVITRNIIRDLLKMRECYVVFPDLHLKNVFADRSGNISWIDTGIIEFKGDTPKFRKKFNQSIQRLLNFYKEERVLSDEEKEQICEACQLPK